jgi:hypothetical protein
VEEVVAMMDLPRNVRHAAALLVHSSDTLKLVTTAGARGLQLGRQNAICLFRASAASSAPRLTDGPSAREFDEILKLAEREARLQRRLASFLERLATSEDQA